MLQSTEVVVYKQQRASYSEQPPFHPPELYPEYPFGPMLDASNEAYSSIRSCLHLLKLDDQNYGKPSWNPFRDLIRPGETVLLKPNMIAHSHEFYDEWQSVITNGSIIRAIIDYVYIALHGRGRIIIADAPQTDSNIELIKKNLSIESIQEFYWREKKFLVDFMDLRNEYWLMKQGVCVKIIKLPGDPNGNVRTDLAANSFFADHYGLGKRYYGAFYDIDEVNEHHTDTRHEYMVSYTILDSDVFISLPKLKTHKKVGVTLNLKGLVGINGNKNWLPHYAIGAAEDNGDQFVRKNTSTRLENHLVIGAKRLLLRRNPIVQIVARKLKKAAYLLFGSTDKVIRSGNWHGNDTCWRMTLDLNRILLYGNIDGSLRTTPKRYFSLIDGVIGMEGNGPVSGKPKAVGYIIAGFNPLATDLVCTKLMGFDYRKIPMLSRAFDDSLYPFAAFSAEDIYVISNQRELHGHLVNLVPRSELRFEPHFGWKGHVEL